jgi:hypothetical protein
MTLEQMLFEFRSQHLDPNDAGKGQRLSDFELGYYTGAAAALNVLGDLMLQKVGLNPAVNKIFDECDVFLNDRVRLRNSRN